MLRLRQRQNRNHMRIKQNRKMLQSGKTSALTK
jgi:hypothetical protein